MKKAILLVSLMLAFVTVSAQENGYIVKTRSAKKSAAKAQAGAQEAEAEGPKDFISENFKYYSLCDWQEGMRFMVMPEKYDLVVRTFTDATTNTEVSSVPLRHKIMVYKGHSTDANGHARINFVCENDNKAYYYQVPSGTFEDYCLNKLGVPTLAYLGDVDIARQKLMGQKMYTKATVYSIDTEYDGDGFQEVQVPQAEEVTVTAIGVGTRSFPVKIIVEDAQGNEFFQNVAISKTNSGLRDDEFVMDNTKHHFYGSFELVDAVMSVSSNIMDYVGKVVHTKYATKMLNEKQTKQVNIVRLTEFTIEEIHPSQGNYYTLLLKNNITMGRYFKDVTFVNESVVGDIDGQREDYFGYLFSMGAGKKRETSAATRAMIREGRVGVGMTEDEVLMAVGDPIKTSEAAGGRYEWRFQRSNNKILVVLFGKDARVQSYRVEQGGTKKTATRRKTTTKKK